MTTPPIDWRPASTTSFEDILFDKAEGIARIAINRPHCHNAFRPETLDEIMLALQLARQDPEIGVVILTGVGTKAFCSGGDQKVRSPIASMRAWVGASTASRRMGSVLEART